MENKEVNLKTVNYTIKEPGFKYHIIKGKFEKGSTISKRKHPNKYVEMMKKKLLDKRKLIDKESCYILKENIYIGSLMAYNLHHGILKTEFDAPKDIVINSKTDNYIKKEFDFKNINSTDAILKNTFEKNSLQIYKIYKYKIKREFLEGNNPNKFSDTEQLVFDILKKENQIVNARHGISNLNEADIVDETLGIQIEVVTAFKAGIKDKLRQKHDTFLVLELIDTNLIKVSEALNKKFYTKNYNNNYKKELSIFCFGNTKSTIELLNKLREMLEANTNVKNNFTKIHFIMYDFLFGKIYYLCNDILESYNDTEFNIDFIEKEEILFSNIIDEEEYIFITQNIFKNEKGISIQKGYDIKKFSKYYEIII